MQHDGAVGAQRDERGDAEVHIAGVTARGCSTPSPARCIEAPHSRRNKNSVIDQTRPGQRSAARPRSATTRKSGSSLKPAQRCHSGLNARVNSRNPNATAGAQEGPKNVGGEVFHNAENDRRRPACPRNSPCRPARKSRKCGRYSRGRRRARIGLNDDQDGSGDRGGRDRQTEGDALDPARVGMPSGAGPCGSCATAWTARPMKSVTT